jgi:hypothetical protein
MTTNKPTPMPLTDEEQADEDREREEELREIHADHEEDRAVDDWRGAND